MMNFRKIENIYIYLLVELKVVDGKQNSNLNCSCVVANCLKVEKSLSFISLFKVHPISLKTQSPEASQQP